MKQLLYVKFLHARWKKEFQIYHLIFLFYWNLNETGQKKNIIEEKKEKSKRKKRALKQTHMRSQAYLKIYAIIILWNLFSNGRLRKDRPKMKPKKYFYY